jgi:hypothetical protein
MGEEALVDDPGQVRGLAPAVHDGPGHAQAHGLDRRARAPGQEPLDRELERDELAARQRALAHECEGPALTLVEQGERGLGAAHVTREDDHFCVPP